MVICHLRQSKKSPFFTTCGVEWCRKLLKNSHASTPLSMKTGTFRDFWDSRFIVDINLNINFPVQTQNVLLTIFQENHKAKVAVD